MADAVTVEVAPGRAFRDVNEGVTYTGGESFEATEETLRRHPKTLRRPDGVSADDTGTEPPFDPSEYTVDELESRLDDNDYSDDELVALADAERDGENRESALDLLK